MWRLWLNIMMLAGCAFWAQGQDYVLHQTLEGHKAKVQNLNFSPDGKTLVSGDVDGNILVWEAATGNLLRQWKGHDAIVVDFSFDRAGARIATASTDGSAKVWQIATGELLGTYYNTHEKMGADEEGWAISFSVFSSDGRFLYFGGDGATIFRAKLGHDDEGKPFEPDVVYSHPVKHELQRITGGELLNDGQIICSIGYQVKIINFADGKEARSFYYSNEPLNDVVLGPKKGQFSTWSLDGMAVIWDIASGKHLQEFYAGDYMEICSPSFSAHQRLMATAAHGHEALVWNIATRTKVATLMGHSGIVRIAKFSPIEDLIATASYDGTVKLWKGPGFPFPDPFAEDDSINSYNGETIVDPMGLNLPVLRFDQSQYVLRQESREMLRRIAKILKDHPELELVIEGHTDDVGHHHKNDRLSHRRATVVANFLETEGIPPTRFHIDAHGSDKPTHINASEESKSFNRRVEMKFIRSM